MRGGRLEIAAINRADDADAAAMILPFVERAPQLAGRIAAHRPFEAPAALIAAVREEIAALDEDDLMAFFRGHPELAPARPSAMTEASQNEQARLNLTALSACTYDRLTALNRRYRQKFGFPFILALHEHGSLASVFEIFERRLSRSPEAEVKAARDAILSVSRARILQAFGLSAADGR
jgi:2-oxo-4-hydroxy-4-carboxy-5-ureidoimidazoline decarboxylase